MKTVFADTSYYVALLNPNDEYHRAARAYTEKFDGNIITTCWILLELGNYLSRAPNRRRFLSLLADLQGDPRVTIVPPSEDIFERGLRRYAERLDKNWSWTDCISFIVMEDMAVADALTTDHHFVQAGFSRILQ